MSNELVHSKATWKRVCVAFGYCHMMPLHIGEVSGGNRILISYVCVFMLCVCVCVGDQASGDRVLCYA